MSEHVYKPNLLNDPERVKRFKMQKPPVNKMKTKYQAPQPLRSRKFSKKQHQESAEIHSDVRKEILSNGSLKKTKVKIENENSINITNSANSVSLVWNSNGWIRVFLGTDRYDLTCEDPNKMMHVTSESKTTDIVKEMVLPEGYTIWVSNAQMSVLKKFMKAL